MEPDPVIVAKVRTYLGSQERSGQPFSALDIQKVSESLEIPPQAVAQALDILIDEPTAAEQGHHWLATAGAATTPRDCMPEPLRVEHPSVRPAPAGFDFATLCYLSERRAARGDPLD